MSSSFSFGLHVCSGDELMTHHLPVRRRNENRRAASVVCRRALFGFVISKKFSFRAATISLACHPPHFERGRSAHGDEEFKANRLDRFSLCLTLQGAKADARRTTLRVMMTSPGFLFVFPSHPTSLSGATCLFWFHFWDVTSIEQIPSPTRRV